MAFVSFCFLCSVPGYTDTLDSLIAKGNKYLDTGAYNDAYEQFQLATQALTNTTDSLQVAQVIFYCGLSKQLHAQQITDSRESQHAYKQALEHYYEALAFAPARASILNNVGKVYSALNQPDSSIMYFSKALNNADTTAYKLYQRNIYEMYLKYEQWERASAVLLDLYLSAPDQVNIYRELKTLYLQYDSTQLISLVEHMILDSLYTPATSVTKDVLITSAWDDESLWRLFLLYVVALSHKETFNTEDFQIPQDWRNLHDSIQRRAVDEFENIVNPSFTDSTNFDWWLQYSSIFKTPLQLKESCGSRKEVFERLVTKLANWHHDWNRLAEAQYYYQKLLSLTEVQPDPHLIIQYSDVLIGQNDMDKLAEFSNEYGPILYQLKGEAYSKNDLKAIYEYHTALGKIFAYLEKEQTPTSEVTSAEYQLEHALTKASEYNEKARQNNDSQIEPDIATVKLLAQTYRRDNRPQQADQLIEKTKTNYLNDNNIVQARLLTENSPPSRPRLKYPKFDQKIKPRDLYLEVYNGSDLDDDELTYEFELYNGKRVIYSQSDIPETPRTTIMELPQHIIRRLLRLNDNELLWRARCFDSQRYSPWSMLSPFQLLKAKEINDTIPPAPPQLEIRAYPNPVSLRSGFTVTFTLPEQSVDLLIQTVSGETVIYKQGVRGNWSWNGRNNQGQLVSQGVYLWYVKERNAQGKIVVIK